MAGQAVNVTMPDGTIRSALAVTAWHEAGNGFPAPGYHKFLVFTGDMNPNAEVTIYLPSGITNVGGREQSILLF